MSKKEPMRKYGSACDLIWQAEREADMKWGKGRLRLLVGEDLRARFDKQVELFEQAALVCADRGLPEDALADLDYQAQALKRGFDALDKAATDAGAKPIDSDVFEFELNTGEKSVVGWIVRDGRDIAKLEQVQRDGRELCVFTIDEVSRVLARYYAGGVGKVKEYFPGAEITAIKSDPIHESDLNDAIPF